MEQGWWVIAKTILSLGAVIALIYALSWVAKKYLRPERWAGMGATGIKVIQTFLLEPRKKLLVVEIENQKLLLGVAENSISYLCALDSNPSQKAGSHEM